MTFKPWEELKVAAPHMLAVDIAAPPCPNCQFWRPRIKTDHRGEFDGVVLCTNYGEQCNDFSCFRDK